MLNVNNLLDVLSNLNTSDDSLENFFLNPIGLKSQNIYDLLLSPVKDLPEVRNEGLSINLPTLNNQGLQTTATKPKVSGGNTTTSPQLNTSFVGGMRNPTINEPQMVNTPNTPQGVTSPNIDNGFVTSNPNMLGLANFLATIGAGMSPKGSLGNMLGGATANFTRNILANMLSRGTNQNF